MVDLPRSVWMPALAAFLAVAFGTVALVLIWEWLREQSRRRAMASQLRQLVDSPDLGVSESVLRSQRAQGLLGSSAVARLPHLQDIQTLIAQAGMSWTVGTYLLVTMGSILAVGLLGLLLGRTPFHGIGGAVFGGLLPYWYVRRQRTRRLNAFEELLPESIDLIGRALRAGHPLSSGFKMAADDGSEPVSTELRRVFEEQRFGMPLEDSLLGMADRVNLVDVRILVTAILIQREVGGNLAEILDNLSSVIRARFTIRRQIRVYTAQGRMTGYLLAVLPIALMILLYTMNPEYMSLLFTDPTGKLLLGVGAGLQLLGFLWIRKIVNIEI